MSSFPVSNSLNALLLGFLCCLGITAAKDGDTEKKAAKVELFSLNEVHSQSDQLIPAINAGDDLPPPGYRLCPFPVTDDDGKRIGTRYILVSTQNIVTAKDIQLARSTAAFGEVAVLLTPAGGKRVSNATGKMQLGRDRIAVLLEGKGLIAPTVQAPLGREFVINGLGGKEEVNRVVHAFNAPIKDPQ